MRTNVVLDDDLVREAQQYVHLPTKRALLEEALRTLIRVKAEEVRRTTLADRVYDLDRRLAGLRVREAPSSILREDRQRAW